MSDKSPIYILNSSGIAVPVSATNPIPTTASLGASSIAINDGTVTSQKLHVDASGNLYAVLSAGSNIVGIFKLVDSGGVNQLAINASGQIGISNFPGTQPVSGSISVSNFPAAFEIFDGGGVNKLAVNASGQITITNSSFGVSSLPSIPAGSAIIGTVELADSGGVNKLAINASGQIPISNFPVAFEIFDSGGVNKLGVDSSGRVTVLGSGEFNANINQVNGATLSATNPIFEQGVVGSTGGSKPYHNLTAASTNFTNVKSVACMMYGYSISNTSTSVIYVKFYDKATTPGTGDVPKHTIAVPANSPTLRAIPEGMIFANGFGWAATGAVADNDNTSIAANCVVDFSLNA